jgi:hypothetical protein
VEVSTHETSFCRSPYNRRCPEAVQHLRIDRASYFDPEASVSGVTDTHMCTTEIVLLFVHILYIPSA